MGFTAATLAFAGLAYAQSGGRLAVNQTADGFELSLDDGPPFHVTDRPIRDVRLIELPNSATLVVLWSEEEQVDKLLPFYVIY